MMGGVDDGRAGEGWPVRGKSDRKARQPRDLEPWRAGEWKAEASLRRLTRGDRLSEQCRVLFGVRRLLRGSDPDPNPDVVAVAVAENEMDGADDTRMGEGAASPEEDDKEDAGKPEGE
jgi:hypothetical protein